MCIIIKGGMIDYYKRLFRVFFPINTYKRKIKVNINIFPLNSASSTEIA